MMSGLVKEIKDELKAAILSAIEMKTQIAVLDERTTSQSSKLDQVIDRLDVALRDRDREIEELKRRVATLEARFAAAVEEAIFSAVRSTGQPPVEIDLSDSRPELPLSCDSAGSQKAQDGHNEAIAERRDKRKGASQQTTK